VFNHGGCSVVSRIVFVVNATPSLPTCSSYSVPTYSGTACQDIIYWRERERERDREIERERERERERIKGVIVRDTTFKGGKENKCSCSGFEGSQAVPARPSGRGKFEEG
jgi:hypothetical protein